MNDKPDAHMALEKALAADASGEVREGLKNDFLVRAREVQGVINRGVPPERYQRLVMYSRALDAAAQVVDEMWHRLRRSA